MVSSWITFPRLVRVAVQQSPKAQFRPRVTIYPTQHRCYATTQRRLQTILINGRKYDTDITCNVPKHVYTAAERRLHLQKDHPIALTRQIIEAHFPASTFVRHNDLDPVVTVAQNFDSLGFPNDHPGRASSDTYYIRKDLLLRTHTSAHQAELFAARAADGFLVSADVYRRDAIDRTHYPVFHQMEGARVWDRAAHADLAAAIRADTEKLPTHNVVVEDPNPPFDAVRNPQQSEHHSAAETQAIAAHLKRSLENMVVDVFTRAKAAIPRPSVRDSKRALEYEELQAEPLRMRWVEATFPFTSPSYELEVYYNGSWLEVLGCGVVQQGILQRAGVGSQVGWAFGLGIDRIAMLLMRIPDIRLFWSQDQRFLGQFEGVSHNLDKLKTFKPFSRHPGCYKDMSFWVSETRPTHENDIMEIVRRVGKDLVEAVELLSEYKHPETGRRSVCYRIMFRAIDRTLLNNEINQLMTIIREDLTKQLDASMR